MSWLQGTYLCCLGSSDTSKAGNKNRFYKNQKALVPSSLPSVQGHRQSPHLQFPPLSHLLSLWLQGSTKSQLQHAIHQLALLKDSLVTARQLPCLGEAFTTFPFHFLFHTNKCVFPLPSTQSPCTVNRFPELTLQAKPHRERWYLNHHCPLSCLPMYLYLKYKTGTFEERLVPFFHLKVAGKCDSKAEPHDWQKCFAAFTLHLKI